MFGEQQFTRVRSLTNAVIAEENRQSSTRTQASVRRTSRGALISVALQEGTVRPSDPHSHLGGLCDRIVGELRLERDELGRPAYRTDETTFTSGEAPVFSFEVYPAF